MGTVDADGHLPIATSRSDSLKIFELSMELEETKLNMRNLKNENKELRRQIANIMASEHENEREVNMQNHLKIIEDIIAERNDLKELLDKFLGVTDQIIEMKVQADQMRNIESEYSLLQTKFRDHQMELETLRKERESFEERILNLESTNEETNTLKVYLFDFFLLANIILVLVRTITCRPR